MKNATKLLVLVTFGLLLMIAGACKSPKDTSAPGSASPAVRKASELKAGEVQSGDLPTLANPAATKCADDGYVLKPVMENGVSVGYLCLNPDTGLECKVWAYFRGECHLVK